MARRFIGSSDILELTAPRNLAQWEGALVNGIFGVAKYDVASGRRERFITQGIVTLAKVPGETWAQGDDIYWNDVTYLCSNVATGNRLIGNAITATTGSTGEVRLRGIAHPKTHTPERMAQSYAPLQRDGAATGSDQWMTLVSVTVPGGALGVNGKLVIVVDWDCSNSALTKSLGLDWGGSNFAAPSLTTQQYLKAMVEIQNIGVASQRVQNTNNFATNSSYVSLTKDTSGDVALDIKCKWSQANAAGERIILLGHSVWLYPGD